MRCFGRQCRGQGHVLVKLVRHTEQKLLALGEPITALGQHAQQLLDQATTLSDAQRQRVAGYPLKAGQCMTSTPASTIALALPRSGQSGHVGEDSLKEVWKLPTKKACGRRRAIRGATIEVMQMVHTLWRCRGSPRWL